MTYYVRGGEKVTGPPGPGQVTTGMGGLDMTKHNRDLVKRGAAPSTSGSGQVTGRRAVTFARGGAVVQGCGAHLACRIGARALAAKRNPGQQWSSFQCPTLITSAAVAS